MLVSQISLISLAAPSSQKPGPTNLLNHQLHQHRQLQQTAPPAPLPQRGIRMQMQLEKAMVMGENGTSNKSNECFCKLHLNYPLSVWPLCNPHFSSSQPPPLPLRILILLMHSFIYSLALSFAAFGAGPFGWVGPFCVWLPHGHGHTGILGADNGQQTAAAKQQQQLAGKVDQTAKVNKHFAPWWPQTLFVPSRSVHGNLECVFVANWNWMQIEKQTLLRMRHERT